MAKKKADSKPHKPQDKTHYHHHHHHQTMADAAASENSQLDNLKSLNAMLVKETAVLRQQVDSLVQSKGYLESELNRSAMDNASLQSQMNALAEQVLMVEIEKGLVSIFVTSHVNQLAEVVGKEMDGFCRERVVMEARIENFKGDMKRVLEEKSEIEKSKGEKESEIGDLNTRLEQLMAEINNEKAVVSRVCDEKDEIRVQLDARIQEVNELQLKVTQADKREAMISQDLTELKANYDRLVEENTASERRIESILAEKDSIETNVVELNMLVDDSKQKIAELLEQKTAIEGEKKKQERENDELQTEVGKLDDLVQSMRIKEGALLEKLADLEKRYAESSSKEMDMKTEIDRFVEEKKETEERISNLVNEKSLVVKDLEDAMKELEHQKLAIEKIVQNKTEIEDAKIQGETEGLKMKEQLIEFQEKISSLENSKLDQNEKLEQLQFEISHYKASFDRVKIERDEAQKGLEEEKTITTDYKQRIIGFEKEIEDLNEELGKMTTANGKHLEEKNELENRCASLVEKVASLEAEHAEARTECDVTKDKLGLAEAKSNRVLKILKRTVSDSVETSDFDQENGMDEEMKDHVTDLEAIKGAFKDKANRIEDMKMQLELFKNSAAEAHKEKSFWTMVSSATTLLAAAVSVAYVARAH
ncbi:centrosomal protein of 55 kDa-like [Cynara cardunculus var. scolymus]|uniref:centrosomal protein of 55 kDa-like n=1 Tax=Cynara cardunculus var. scolymus TaxID=59895 RepID=UPI000D63055A|nr:centrosomal protein of 55 kDa-like [Cynara cardunculus var. scolymus]